MLQTYADRFSHLHTDRSRSRWTADTAFRAPHKPLLLLSVIDVAAEGLLAANLVEPTADLLDTFRLYWGRVFPHDRRGKAALPFFHLRSAGFWCLVPQPGQEDVLPALRQIDTMGELRKRVLGARLDEELYTLLNDAPGREALRRVLVETYFAPHLRPGLYEQGQVNQDAFAYSNELLEGQPEKTREYALPDVTLSFRSQGFRRAVTVAYERRCALCGIRVVTSAGHTAVDAGHIVPWSVSHDDRVNNGLSLCRLCHWCFDEGVIAVSERYQVVTARDLIQYPNLPGHISQLDRREILRPDATMLWPDLSSLAWHRREVFRKR